MDSRQEDSEPSTSVGRGFGPAVVLVDRDRENRGWGWARPLAGCGALARGAALLGGGLGAAHPLRRDPASGEILGAEGRPPHSQGVRRKPDTSMEFDEKILAELFDEEDQVVVDDEEHLLILASLAGLLAENQGGPLKVHSLHSYILVTNDNTKGVIMLVINYAGSSTGRLIRVNT